MVSPQVSSLRKMNGAIMEKCKIEHGTWIVVCDGRKALILENAGDTKVPNFRMRETHEHADEPTHALGTAPPGRTFQSMGYRRGAVTQTDWHDQAERSFLHALAKRLDTALAEGRVRKLIMVASPRALGMIRETYSAALRHAINREIAKDLVKSPIHEIEQAIVLAH